MSGTPAGGMTPALADAVIEEVLLACGGGTLAVVGQGAAHCVRAALRIARLNLDYTTIKAPIDGRMSRAEVTIGNLVSTTGGPALTTLVSSDRIYAAFDDPASPRRAPGGPGGPRARA